MPHRVYFKAGLDPGDMFAVVALGRLCFAEPILSAWAHLRSQRTTHVLHSRERFGAMGLGVGCPSFDCRGVPASQALVERMTKIN